MLKECKIRYFFFISMVEIKKNDNIESEGGVEYRGKNFFVYCGERVNWYKFFKG